MEIHIKGEPMEILEFLSAISGKKIMSNADWLENQLVYKCKNADIVSKKAIK